MLNNREWTWANDNVLSLSKELNATDAESFNFRLHDLDWREYWLNYFIALRTHYFKVHSRLGAIVIICYQKRTFLTLKIFG